MEKPPNDIDEQEPYASAVKDIEGILRDDRYPEALKRWMIAVRIWYLVEKARG